MFAAGLYFITGLLIIGISGEYMVKKRDLKIAVSSFLCGSIFFGGVSFAASSAQNISVYFQPLKYFFDGQLKTPQEGAGFIYNNVTYVPLRFVSESLGKEVHFDPKTYSIYLGQMPEQTTGITQDQAIELVRNVVTSKTNTKFVYTIDHTEGSKYVVHVYEDMIDHMATYNWYYVDMNTGEITAMF
jgi:hypothetical protein